MRGEPSTDDRITQRVLALKVSIDWKRDEDKALFNRLRDLGWMAARYRNSMIRRLWAEAMGFRVDPEKQDKHDVTKQGRQKDKGDLSGAAYSAAEREVSGAWQRDVKKILAGQPLPEWKPTAALSVRGHKDKSESGVRLEVENEQYVAYLQAQSKESPGGCWLRLPIAKHARQDEHQGDILRSMIAWSVPIAKATVHLNTREITLRLTYALRMPPLRPMGERVATLGPVRRDAPSGALSLHLRTETQTKDYSAKLNNLMRREDEWELIRRRAMRQIGWHKGHAREKRERLAGLTIEDWKHTYLHTWTREIADWCAGQGVGIIQVVGLEQGNWQSYKFVQQLKYKAEEVGIIVMDYADVAEPSSERAAKSAITRQSHKAKRRRAAVNELENQIGA